MESEGITKGLKAQSERLKMRCNECFLARAKYKAHSKYERTKKT